MNKNDIQLLEISKSNSKLQKKNPKIHISFFSFLRYLSLKFFGKGLDEKSKIISNVKIYKKNILTFLPLFNMDKRQIKSKKMYLIKNKGFYTIE